MKKIKLTQGKYALVDDEDFARVNQHKWHAQKLGSNWYARGRCGNRVLKVFMHRFIMNAPKGKYLDHIDGNGLNNQKLNLRFATCQENNRNRKKTPGCTSDYKGVHWSTCKRKWRACIKVDYGRIHLGRFDLEPSAAIAYNRAAVKYFGKFAKLNELRLGL